MFLAFLHRSYSYEAAHVTYLPYNILSVLYGVALRCFGLLSAHVRFTLHSVVLNINT